MSPHLPHNSLISPNSILAIHLLALQQIPFILPDTPPFAPNV